MSDVGDWGANIGWRLDELGDDVPLPPYQVKGCTIVMIGVEFDPSVVVSLLPAGFDPVEQTSGGVFCYTALSGGGIAPYGAMAVWFDVKGYDSPDGSFARFVPRSFFSGRAAVALGRFGTGPRTGETELFESNGVVSGVTKSESGDIARLTVRPSGEELPTSTGVHYYVFANRAGSLSMFSLAFTYEVQTARPVGVEFLGGDGLLDGLGSVKSTWAAYLRNGALTIGAAQDLEQFPVVDAVESRSVLAGILNKIGTAAFILDKSGSVLFQNDLARGLAGDGIRISEGKIKTWSAEAQRELVGAVKAAFRTAPAGFPAEPVAIERPSGKKPFLVSIAALTGAPESLGRRALPSAQSTLALALVGDPNQPAAADPMGALQVMGLTRAEAQVAALVGSGASPRDTAGTLGKTEGTVRTTLKQAYSKLDLSRQSELALLVSRIGSLGF